LGSAVLLKPGNVVANRFWIEQELGRGGMGVVYRVMDQQCKQRRALKLLLPEFSEGERAITRFKREAKVLRALDHPGIVKVFDTGRISGTLFFTMEFVEGVSLAAHLKAHGPLPLSFIRKLVASLADALDYAHPGVVHRDLSPDNVMLLPGGALKLLDFGTAKFTEDSDGLTSIGMSIGKYAYCAPEQRANAASVDGRADVFSLGAMIYEMIKGAPPEPFAPPDTLVTGFSPELDAIVRRALARSPQDRFATAGTLAASLAELPVEGEINAE
jgi:serine/threonine protein kinase